MSDDLDRMPPGCRLDTRVETEQRFPADLPVQTWERKCRRLTDCTDPADNTDWSCGEWHRKE